MPPKKSKDSEPTQTSDSFAPLDLTTRDVRTAVLMLDSPEDTVVAHACDALYKYSSLGDPQRSELLSLDLLPKLGKKLESDEKAIRAHAATCLGSVASLPEGRRSIGEMDCFQQFASLLGDDEDNITREVGCYDQGLI